MKEPTLIIAYEDNEIIIAEKPSGIPSVATLDPKRDHFYGQVNRYLDKKKGRASYLAAHHRLDVSTSGLLLFSKKKSMNKPIADLFSNREIKKTYLAHCLNLNPKITKQNWKVENYLKKEVEDKLLISKATKSGGKKAVTKFKVLKQEENRLLIEARPMTGRMHQIRSHLADSNLPILGDNTYCASQVEKLSSRLMLHAHRLEFNHPKTNEKMIVESASGEMFYNLEMPIKK